MRTTITHKSTIAVIAFVGTAMLIAGIAAPVTATSAPFCESTTIGGNFTSPFGQVGSWTLTTDVTPSSVSQRGALVQGGLSGTFTNNLGLSPAVVGGWSFNTATGKLLMKVVGANFYIDYAFLNLPSAGFTVQGSLHVVGQQPVPLVETAPTVIIPVTCS